MRERLLSSQEQFHQDVENEISDAMSDTIIGEENLDGEPISFFLTFCLLFSPGFTD